MRAKSDICCAAIKIPHTEVMRDAYQKPEAAQYASWTLDQENDAVTIAVTVIPYMNGHHFPIHLQGIDQWCGLGKGTTNCNGNKAQLIFLSDSPA